MKKDNVQNNITYPRFIDNIVVGEDLFEGKSHTLIAQNISNLLQSNKSCNVIGIEGGWGAGKSNLIKLIEKDTKQNGKFHFFIYDSWGFQNDFQRRSILENLTSYLIDDAKLLKGKEWNGRLLQLLSRTKTINSKVVKELNAISKCTIIYSLLLPFANILFTKLPDGIVKNLFWIMYFIFFFIAVILVQKRDMKKYGQKITLESFWKNLFYSFLDYTENKENVEQAIKTETIYEAEPSSRDFKNWMNDINNDLKTEKLVIVFDNMDRLPCKKVQELWAVITTFFSESNYENIKVLIPFDREHIKTAFKSEDISHPDNRISYGNDFINKTFNVVFRVSPPTMINWKNYFSAMWKNAFSDNVETEILQIYDLLSDEYTPRKIIAFINEFVEIKLLFSTENIPNKYVALYILGKEKISKNPKGEIIKPSFLGALEFMYKNDVDLPKFLSALYYQLPIEKALDIVYTEELRTALNNCEPEKIKNIQLLPDFFHLLTNVIPNIANIENTVLSLNQCFIGTNKIEEQKIWDSIYKQAKGADSDLYEWQEILLSKITDKINYLISIIDNFYNSKDFDVVKFCQNIDRLDAIEGINPFDHLIEKNLIPEDFIKFVEYTKTEYEKYKFSCSYETLSQYLTTLSVSELENLNVIKYLQNKEEFPDFYERKLIEQIDLNKNDENSLDILYERLKEVQRPVKKILTNNIIYTHFQKTYKENPFYFDLLCMRISKKTNFENQYQPVFDSALKITDEDFIEEVCNRIEYYFIYGDILLSLDTMKKYPLYVTVAKRLTEKKYGQSSASISTLLKSYDLIRNNLEIESKIILNRFDGWAVYAKEEIKIDNINEIPFSFFEDSQNVNNDLTQHCRNIAIQYIKQFSIDEWKEFILKQKFEYKLLILFEEKFEPAFEAFKELMKENLQADGITKDVSKQLIILAEKNKRSLKSMFKDIRDAFCSGNYTMSKKHFNFYGECLFKYGDLIERNDALRRILPAEILDDDFVISILIKEQKVVLKMINNAGEESQDFKDKLSSLIEMKKDNQQFLDFVKAIGIEMKSE